MHDNVLITIMTIITMHDNVPVPVIVTSHLVSEQVEKN